MVLEMCAFMATGAQITVAAIRNGYKARSSQWIQVSTRRGRAAALHDREGGGSERIAKEPYMFESYRPAAVQGLCKLGTQP